MCKKRVESFSVSVSIFIFFFGYERSSITIFRIYISIYSQGVVGHYGKLVSVKIQ